jgi:hypothetical protein
MTVDQLGDYLKQHWPDIREQLLKGTYEEYTGVYRMMSVGCATRGCSSRRAGVSLGGS